MSLTGRGEPVGGVPAAGCLGLSASRVTTQQPLLLEPSLKWVFIVTLAAAMLLSTYLGAVLMGNFATGLDITRANLGQSLYRDFIIYRLQLLFNGHCGWGRLVRAGISTSKLSSGATKHYY